MAAWYLTSGTYRTNDWVEEIRSAQVTAHFFDVLGVEPILSRDFRAEEVVRHGPVILSHRVWQRLFRGDSTIIGQKITSSGSSYEIIGVMPAGFSFPDPSVETWVAWDLPSVYADRPQARTWRFLQGIGRLAEGVSMEVTEQSLDVVAADLAEIYPDANTGWETEITSLHEEAVAEVKTTIWVAFGAAVFILLIACANVANLLLANVPARTRELSIRSAVGASRGQVDPITALRFD